MVIVHYVVCEYNNNNNNNNNILFYSANIQFNKNLFSALSKVIVTVEYKFK